jgi:hypothetical protein
LVSGACWTATRQANSTGSRRARRGGRRAGDHRQGRPSLRRVPADDEAEIERLYRTRYHGFTARHFYDLLVRDHLCRWSYAWTKLFLQSKGLLERAPRRGAHRRRRPRRPLPGMLLYQDGSRHEWLAGQPAMDLIVTMDDATSENYAAFLVVEEILPQPFGHSWMCLARVVCRSLHIPTAAVTTCRASCVRTSSGRV